MRRLLKLTLLLLVAPLAWANTPGKHTVVLTWTVANTCSTGSTCTTNLYRGTTANVCSGTPTPYITGIVGNSVVDPNPPAGAVFYNVSTVDPGKGGESTCDGEVQVTVQPITTTSPSGLQGTQQ